MGINIGICEMEAKNAACRELRSTIIRVHVDSEKGFEEVSTLKWNNAAAKMKAVYSDAINSTNN